MDLIETLKVGYMELSNNSMEPKCVGELDENLIKNALIKICDLYLEPKSRNFLKHLVTAFYPINDENLIMTLPREVIDGKQNKCAITGVKVAQIKDIVKYYGGNLIDGMTWNNGLEHTPVNARKGQMKKNCPAVPIEVRNATYGYLSGISNKYLSGEAMVALTIFILDCIEDEDNDISKLIMRPRKIGQEDRTDKHNTNFAMKNLIKEDIIEKLEMIK